MDSKQNRERMESGKLYFPADEAVMAEQTACMERLWEYNQSRPSEGEKRARMLEELFARVGKNAYIEGYTIGGKTATSQTLPRSANRYISSFLGFAPAENPQILGLCIIHDPQGVYYGGTIAAPVIRDIFENVLPYLDIPKTGKVQDKDGSAENT